MSLDDSPTVVEVEKAIAALSNSKAPGSDAIPVKIYKAGGTRLVIKINEPFETIWNAEGIPREFKNVSNVHIYKTKGNRQCWDKHRGMTAPGSSSGAPLTGTSA